MPGILLAGLRRSSVALDAKAKNKKGGKGEAKAGKDTAPIVAQWREVRRREIERTETRRAAKAQAQEAATGITILNLRQVTGASSISSLHRSMLADDSDDESDQGDHTPSRQSIDLTAEMELEGMLNLD